MSEWQPIETAPKDGTWVLLGWAGGGHAIGRWRFNGRVNEAYFSWSEEWDDYESMASPPTHWQALSTPPRETHKP